MHDKQSIKNSFNWLRREARGPTYISYSEFSDRPACSFEFGENGCAASCNYGGGLLHMSAKDENRGIIFAHGNFEPTYYSCLARAQRQQGDEATFGLDIAVDRKPFDKTDTRTYEGSSLRLGEMTERGCFNYRWPVNEYALLLNEDDNSEVKETGTCTRISFVKDDILYQVIKLEPGCRPEADICYVFPRTGRIVLTIGGKIKFRVFDKSQDKGLLNELDIRVSRFNGQWYDMLKELKLSDDERNKRLNSPGAKPENAFSAELSGMKHSNSDDRQVTFIAEFKLRTSGNKLAWAETPTSEQIYDYLGINPSSVTATGVMWEALFLQREEKYAYGFSEANLTGRCIEKILTVDLIPAAFGKEGCRKFEKGGPLALVSNLFLQPSIDLQSLFWKVRCLVDAYRFLFNFHSPAQQPSGDKGKPVELPEITNKIVNRQMKRLKGYIERTISYLVEAFIRPNTENNLLSPCPETSHPNYYYVMITIWYAVNKCEKIEWTGVDEMKTWDLGDDSHLVRYLPSDSRRFEGKEKERIAFLKWYHHASVLNLSRNRKEEIRGLREKVGFLARNARRIVTAKLSSLQPYSAKDEILERLGFLAESLDAAGFNTCRGSITLITRRHILNRDPAGYLNPGRLPSGKKGLTCAPWEIHALCHHSQLLALSYESMKSSEETREKRAEDTEKYWQRISQFQNAEACIVPCWERTNMTSFQSEATSVLASTLFNLYQQDLRPEALEDPKIGVAEMEQIDWNPTTGSIQRSAPKTQLKPNPLNSTSRMHGFRLDALNGGSPTVEFLTKLESLQRNEAVKLPSIEWMRYRHPHKYHHENFYHSLEDTPSIFKDSRTDERTVALLSRYGESSPQEYLNEDNIKHMFERHKLSIIDFKARVPGPRNGRIWQGYLQEPAGFDTKKQDNDTVNEKTKKLTDSLVDQEIQHRTIILSTPSFDCRLLALFSCVFHRGSTDCFIAHDSRFPDFSCQKGDTWTTRITLRSWYRSITTTNGKNSGSVDPSGTATPSIDQICDHQALLSNDEDAPIMMLDSLKKALESLNKAAFRAERENPVQVKLRISSIVLSTYGFGDFSRCTIISELLDKKHKEIGEKTKDLWEKFIHQPQTARCLVFLTVLGFLCQEIAAEYRDAMNYFIQTLKLDKSFIFDEIKLLEGKHSLKQLQLGLWSLESLFKLQNSLAMSMRCIDEASSELQTQINHGPGKRGETLERMCQESLEDFERMSSQLVVLNAELDRKIRLNSRYKDSLSNILSLQDSRNSIRQNSTIQRLTYLTIGYLPIGLATAIFAIPGDQQVLIPSMGMKGYVVCIFCMFILTFVLAAFMEEILAGFRGLREIWHPNGGGGGSGSSATAKTPQRDGDDGDPPNPPTSVSSSSFRSSFRKSRPPDLDPELGRR
ncbi:hypothetical protein F4779DRAFT_601025 [Xylariaceae sp. FL0662B]|nr:hypothetical protein F4779DRAFT_601025 [Xylariaceae sp. FL0662B]